MFSTRFFPAGQKQLHQSKEKTFQLDFLPFLFIDPSSTSLTRNFFRGVSDGFTTFSFGIWPLLRLEEPKFGFLIFTAVMLQF